MSVVNGKFPSLPLRPFPGVLGTRFKSSLFTPSTPRPSGLRPGPGVVGSWSRRRASRQVSRTEVCPSRRGVSGPCGKRSRVPRVVPDPDEVKTSPFSTRPPSVSPPRPSRRVGSSLSTRSGRSSWTLNRRLSLYRCPTRPQGPRRRWRSASTWYPRRCLTSSDLESHIRWAVGCGRLDK